MVKHSEESSTTVMSGISQKYIGRTLLYVLQQIMK